MPDLLDSLAWVVHPLGALTLAFLASVVFTHRRQHWPPVLAGVLALVLLSWLGADWLVHPAAALCIAVLAANIFHAWRREWVTVVFALLALSLFSALGATWAVFPIVGLGIAWLATVLFSGDLFRTPGARPSVQQVPRTAAALPAQGSGEAFDLGAMQERIQARYERKAGKRVARLQRKLERKGMLPPANLGAGAPRTPLQAPPEPPVSLQKAPSGDLEALAGDPRLPGDARARLAALNLRAREAQAYLKDRDLDGAEPGFLLRQIMTDYAPEAVQAYLKLPPSLAGVTPLQDGKTGRDLLNEQLDLLLDAVRDVMVDAAQAGSQEMLAHQRFLQDKFGKKPSDFEL